MKYGYINTNENVAIASEVLLQIYSPKYGVSVKSIADELIEEMREDYCEHRDYFTDCGEPFDNSGLNRDVFQKWLLKVVKAKNNFIENHEKLLSNDL